MGMAQGNRQSIRRIGVSDLHARQLQAHHVIDLFLVGMPDPNYGFLDRIRCILCNRDTCLRRNQQANRPGLAQFQCAHSVFVHKSLLNRCLVWRVALNDCIQLAMKRKKSLRQIRA